MRGAMCASHASRPMFTWRLGRKGHSARFHGTEGIRRKPFTPTAMVLTTLPLTPSSVPLCPLLSPRDQWPTHEKHISGH